MAENFKLVVRHVRYWRGVLHKWSTVYPYVSTTEGTSMTPTLLERVATDDSEICYFGPDEEQGCVYQADFYSEALGGSPLLSATYGDPENPASGTLVNGGAWSSVDVDADPVAETALIVNWPAGLSRTGKGVYFRKYYHAVALSQAVAGGPDVLTAVRDAVAGYAADITVALVSGGFAFGNTSRLPSGDAAADAYYGNHQMPRGRRITRVGSSGAHITYVPNLVPPGSSDD